MTHIAVILSGCGHMDGSEIRESVLSLLYLDQMGAKVQCFAPEMELDEINHLTGKPTGARRQLTVEAARIARGEVKPLAQAQASDFDALVMPGGFGAAKNLSDFVSKGAKCTVRPELQKLIREFHAAKKPIGAICIAPAVLAAALAGVAKPKVTIGDDAGTAGAIEAMGARHENCATENCVVDAENRLVTCPAYMRNDRLSHIAEGIEKTIREVMKMAGAAQQKAA